MFAKKILSITAIASCVFAASCLKNDDSTTTPTTPAVDPSLEMTAIDRFTDSMGYTNMQYDYNLTGFKYEVIKMGDTLNGKITSNTPVGVLKYIGRLMNGTAFDSSYKTSADSTLTINFTQYQVIKAWGYVLFPGTLPVKIGKGGRIRFVTPSAYAYGPYSQGSIPANSPLFFDLELKDVKSY